MYTGLAVRLAVVAVSAASVRAATDITSQITANSGANNIALAGSSYSVTTTSASPIVYSGILSGTGSIEVTGSGTLILGNTNTYTPPAITESTTEAYFSGTDKQFASYEGYTTEFTPALANGDDGGFNGSTYILHDGSSNQPDPPAITIDSGVDLQFGSNTDLHTGGQSTVILGNIENPSTSNINLDNVLDNGTLTFQGDGNFSDTQTVGQISGTGAVIVQTGNMQLYDANTFSGPLLIENNMTLILGSDHVTGSVPNASVVFNNGTFILNTPFDMPTASPMTITQTIYENHFGNDINVNGFGGLVILAGVYTYTDNSNNGNVPSGQMNPTLSSANDNFINELNVIDNRRGINIGISGGTGSTNPSGGIVQMGNGSSTSFFLPGNPLTTYISLEQNSILALDYSNSGPTYVNTIIAGGPTGTSDVQESLATAGTGTVIFHQGHIVVTQQQYYDGTTQIDSGATLQLGDGTMGDTVLTSAGVISSQTSGGDGDIMQSGQTVSVTDTTKTGTSPQAGHFSTSVGTSANRIINNGRIVVDNVNATLLSNLSGTGTLTQAGAGTTTLGPSISYMGATLIAGGTLAITSGSSLASSSSVTISSAGRSSLVAVPYSAANTNVATVGAPVLDVSQAGSQTVSNLGGDATARIFLGANNLTINSSASTVFGGQVADGGIAGGTGGGLTKTGPSTFTLSNADTYTGGTTISAGKLIIANTSGTATGSGPVSVLNTATLAGGGSIGGSLQTSSGSQMSPGSAANSVLAVGGAASFASGTTFNVALATPNVGGGLDGNVLISVAGSLTLGNATIWNVTVGPTFAVGTYDLIDYGGALSDPNGFTNWAFAGLPSGDVFHVQNATDGSLNSIQLDVTAVPEPRWPLVYLAGLGLFALPRPRRLRHE